MRSVFPRSILSIAKRKLYSLTNLWSSVFNSVPHPTVCSSSCNFLCNSFSCSVVNNFHFISCATPCFRCTQEPSRGPSLGLLTRAPTSRLLSFSVLSIFGASILGTLLLGFMVAIICPLPTVTGWAVKFFNIILAQLEPGDM